ncbi:TetR/AcrR family transcriptional regulator [Mycobacterium sp. HUMS_1102779]|uniref:TetR/AcrR family transcriptional regulator n=1 Tax=Mycobacterium sp. HUMS_1102779 TaxID=3383487 RepID=UPI003899E14C
MAGQGQRARRGSAPGLLEDAAREVFAERAYGATTREIASRAGVSHDLIFRYFDNKEKLFFDAVVTPLLDAVGGLHHRWLDHPALTTMSHDRLVRRFAAGFYEFMSTNQAIARAMVHLFGARRPSARSSVCVNESLKRWRPWLRPSTGISPPRVCVIPRLRCNCA